MNYDHNTWSKWLVTGAVFCLIFDNIPKILQLSTISGGFSCKFSWYFLVILMILWIYQIYRGNFIIEKEDSLFIKYISCLMFIVLLSNILGLVNYPYYNELLLGPSSQIEKLPSVLALLNSHGIHIDEKQLTMVWLGIRSIKGAILSTIYTFGFSFILYQFFKRDWSYYFDLITKVVIASIILLCIYSIIELFYLAKQKGIHTTLDTSGITFTDELKDKFDELMKVTDLVLLDIKHMDPKAHIELTGQKSDNVFAFAEYLKQIAKPVWIRHVVVPGITFHEEDLTALGKYLKTLTNMEKLEVLPYHSMGKVKYDNLGIKYKLIDTPQLTKDEAKQAENMIRKAM